MATDAVIKTRSVINGSTPDWMPRSKLLWAFIAALALHVVMVMFNQYVVEDPQDKIHLGPTLIASLLPLVVGYLKPPVGDEGTRVDVEPK